MYNWSLRFYQLFTRINSHFSKVYAPKLYKSLKSDAFENIYYKRLFFGWYSLILFCGAIFFFVGKSLIAHLSNGIYTDAYPIILLVIILCLIECSYLAVDVPIISKAKTMVGVQLP